MKNKKGIPLYGVEQRKDGMLIPPELIMASSALEAKKKYSKKYGCRPSLLKAWGVA